MVMVAAVVCCGVVFCPQVWWAGGEVRSCADELRNPGGAAAGGSRLWRLGAWKHTSGRSSASPAMVTSSAIQRILNQKAIIVDTNH